VVQSIVEGLAGLHKESVTRTQDQRDDMWLSIGLLGQSMVGKWIRMCSLPIEFLLGKFDLASLRSISTCLGFSVFFPLLALVRRTCHVYDSSVVQAKKAIGMVNMVTVSGRAEKLTLESEIKSESWRYKIAQKQTCLNQLPPPGA
jgi:hypothetical protein